MKRMQVTLEVVTPLFLAGADPRGRPELRAASIRGALRFWLRALVGGLLGDQDLETLREAESAVFGSIKAGASPVVVRVAGSWQAQAFQPLPHSQTKNFSFQGIPPGTSFTLTLTPRPPHHAIPDMALGALLMFILFGGVGKRSRRGFGSLVLRSASSDFPLQPSTYASVDGFSELLPLMIDRSRSLARSLGLEAPQISDPPHFPILHEQYAKVLFCKKAFSGWQEAMKEFWKVLRSDNYRDNPVFGFAGNRRRQASPLHLRIVKIGDAYYLILTVFHVRFAGEQPSWDVMRRFLEESLKKWNGIWIFGGNVKW